MNALSKFLLMTILYTLPLQLLADDTRLSAFHRIAVFPVMSNDISEGLKSSLWWEFRKELSTDTRFLVASKQFLKTKDVYQARGKLLTSDAILLAKHLEADAVLTISYTKRNLTLRSYSAKDGMLIAKVSESIHSSYTAESKLVLTCKRLARKWVSILPYQAFVISREDKELLVELGSEIDSKLLAEAYLVKIDRDNLGELIRGNTKMTMLRKLQFSSIRDGKAIFQELQGEKPYKKTDKQLVYIPQLKLKRELKYLGKGDKVKTTQLLPDLRKSGENKKSTENYYTKVFALINLLIIIALSI